MKKLNKIAALSLGMMFAISAFAAQSSQEPIVRSIELNQVQGQKALISTKKAIYLMPLPFSTQQKKKLLTPQTANLKSTSQSDDLPPSVNNGMNGVPVLDQGMHGSCVTFATTAAIDALLGQGDYVSQLCNLELGSYIEPRSYMPSGWNGSLGGIVLNQMMTYGIVNKTKQTNQGCAGIKQYPLMDSSEGIPMSLDEFKQKSEILVDRIYWEQMLSYQQRFSWTSATQAEMALQRVKRSLAEKQPNTDTRLTFAVALPVDYCSVGACGTYHMPKDSWVMSNAIKNDVNPELGGHEMVIIGYDDNAVAVDNEGAQHKGLLIIRNSWSTAAGDQGNYYMSYDFFKQFVWEVQKITLDKSAN